MSVVLIRFASFVGWLRISALAMEKCMPNSQVQSPLAQKCLGFSLKLQMFVSHVTNYLGNGDRTEELMEQQHHESLTFKTRARISGYKQQRPKASDIEALRNHQGIKKIKEDAIKQMKAPPSSPRCQTRQWRAEWSKQDHDSVLYLPELDGYQDYTAILLDQLRHSVDLEG